MKEKEFREKNIIPLLRNMGYIEVTDTHGIREFGKDIVFSEYDKFGNKKYHAVQTKVGNISGGNKGHIQDIIGHALNAFELVFDDFLTKSPVMLSDYFVITRGKFTRNAKDVIINHARLKLFKYRIYFYEGHHVEELFFRSFQNIKELLTNQIITLKKNQVISNRASEAFDKTQNYYGNLETTSTLLLLNKIRSSEYLSDLVFLLEKYHFLTTSSNLLINTIPLKRSIVGADGEIQFVQNIFHAIRDIALEIAELIVETLKSYDSKTS